MRDEQQFKQRCVKLVREIVPVTSIFFSNIQYTEYMHNVYYERGICYCNNVSERRMKSSTITKARYKNRIQVTMLGVGSGVRNFGKKEQKQINKIAKTNVEYKLDKGRIKITFSVNPHKM